MPDWGASEDHHGGISVSAQNDVVIIGAGPAGIATAIAARLKGLRTLVLDSRTPPIDKPCGEGLLPHGVAALRTLGIHLDSSVAVPFRGIRFADEESSACSEFPEGSGFALRRIRLHQLLVERANEAGVIFHWGTRVTGLNLRHVDAGGTHIPYKWLVGADGQNSTVRKWARLGPLRARGKRFGFRRHFHVKAWPNLVDVYWGENCQMLTTPTDAREICVSVLSRDPSLRIGLALPLFPALAAKLQGATPTSKESGNMTTLNRLPSVTRGRVTMVGDESGSVDAITGHGLSLAFQQALSLAEAFERGNLAHYEFAHRKIAVMPAVMTRLMLLMERNAWVRRRALRLFENKPRLFSKLLSIHTGALSLSSLSLGEMIAFGWKLLKA